MNLHGLHRLGLTIAFALLIAARLAASALAQQPAAPKDAEPATRAAQEAARRSLPPANSIEFDDAQSGFVGTLPDALIAGTGGEPVWSIKPYEFVKGEPEPTVNPSLWRQ